MPRAPRQNELPRADGVDEHTGRPFRYACSSCGYVLSALPRSAACPECNHRGPRAQAPIDESGARLFWSFWIAMGLLALLGSGAILLTMI
jgi:uncharacterized OB-fold protein